MRIILKIKNFLFPHYIDKEVKKIIADKLEIELSIVRDESLLIEDLGADSLDLIEFVIELEDKFMIEVPDKEAREIKTVNDAIKYIKKRIYGYKR